MGILTAQQSAEINRAGTSGMGHLRVVRTTDASLGGGRNAREIRQIAGFGVGSGIEPAGMVPAEIVPVTTRSTEAPSSTGGR